MSTLLDLHDVLGLPPTPTELADHDDRGFVDCRGVLHLWDEED